jgi:hypothetical protein
VTLWNSLKSKVGSQSWWDPKFPTFFLDEHLFVALVSENASENTEEAENRGRGKVLLMMSNQMIIHHLKVVRLIKETREKICLKKKTKMKIKL